MIKPAHILIVAICSAVSPRIGLCSNLTVVQGLKDDPRLLINAQGLAQQDLSVRGSSYADAGIALNGVNLKVPYSAHYNSELALPGLLLADAGVLSGINNVSGHLIGTATVNSRPLDSRSTLRFGLGTKERYNVSVFSSTSDFGGIIDWEKARRIDSGSNDLDRMTGAAFAQFTQNDWQFDILGSGQHKEYGAQGYYGIPADVYAEERTDDALLTASAFKGEFDGSFIRTGVSLREFDSEYRIPTAAFLSDVRSRYGSAMIEGRTLEVQHVALNLRGDLEHERVSGDIGDHSRTRGSILVLPEARFERLTFKAGLNSVFQSDESAEWLPLAGVDYYATDNIRLYASYTETVMQPDFQSLYYVDPYRTGNATLAMQHAQMTELGLHQFLSAEVDWQLAAFHRRQENARDWVKATSADPAWTATDLGTLDVFGMDAKLNYLATEALVIQLYYQWVEKDEYDFYAGLYELDYPEHLLGLSGFWQITPQIQLFGSQTLRRQTDHNTRTSKDFGAEASLGLHYDPRFAKNVRLSCLVENLWDTDFQSIAGLDPRPLSVSAGMSVNW
jgi:iron complex outermembrane receptor protein